MATPLFNDQELALYHQNENADRYQDLKKRAEKVASRYDFNPLDFSTYGNFGNWLANGVSGGGWTHKDRMEKAGFTDDIDAMGKSGQYGGYALGQLDKALTGSIRERTNQLEAGKDLFSGIPVVGGFISAPAQVVSAGKDLAESGISKWQNGKRDWLSDLGAVGETALDIATLGTASKAKAGTNALKAIGKGTLIGSGYGLTGSLNDMGAKNFDAGRAALSTAIGGMIGGGLSGIGYGIGKIKDNSAVRNAVANNQDVKNAQSLLDTAQGKVDTYQKALERAQQAGLDTSSSSALNDSYKEWLKWNHPDKQAGKILLGSGIPEVDAQGAVRATGLDIARASANTDALQNAVNTLQSDSLSNLLGDVDAYQNALNRVYGRATNEAAKANLKNIPKMATSSIKNSKLGKTVSNLLKTKKGKIGAGVGGGLLLAQLLNGKKNDDQEMSDEELYNYVYGGGQ